MTEKEAAERFWAFALELYGQDAAREAFLRLQDRDGADVPMMLWCLWRGVEGQGIPEDVMGDAVEFSAAWRERAVEPLRKLRRALKPGISGVEVTLAEAARLKVAATEQAVERLQMDHLAGLPSDSAKGSPRENMDQYARAATLSLDAGDVSTLVSLC